GSAGVDRRKSRLCDSPRVPLPEYQALTALPQSSIHSRASGEGDRAQDGLDHPLDSVCAGHRLRDESSLRTSTRTGKLIRRIATVTRPIAVIGTIMPSSI